MADINNPDSDPTATSDPSDAINCGPGGGADDYLQLRIASIFVILVGSLLGTLFPIIAKRTNLVNVPEWFFNFLKYFGSGVIIATAFIHLLAPGIEALSSPCLSEDWTIYPYALAFAMLSIFVLFIVELIAFRWGTSKLAALGLSHDHHGHDVGGQTVAHGPEGEHRPEKTESDKLAEVESQDEELAATTSSAAARQIIGVFILEFGVILHSVLIGLTLAVDGDFKTLFVVLVFHQTFEGLGLGTRLAHLALPKSYNYVAIIGALIYGITTPVGIAVGLGVRSSYNPGSTTASIVSGTMDSLSAGVLLYTGLVELLAHDFLFNKSMMTASNAKVAYAITSMLAGVALMSLLGRWA